ncbi:MAG: outer membrane lipoprotein-sorting protein [Prolixibacteraceae bacterium]|nr:outer membrane lipoprotein-sorting protein [Prolixibacteraceae bacterium]
MKKHLVLLVTILLLSIINTHGQSAQEIMKKSSDIISLDAMEMVSTLKIFNEKGTERTRKMATISKKFGQTTKMIMKFTEPADVRGTAILIYDYENQNDDMWIYLPAIRKSRRVVSSDKGRNFMGSEFTNSDMSKPNPDDFSYKILGDVTIDSKECWKIESTPKSEALNSEYGFSKRISLVDKQDFHVFEIEYHDLKGNLQRKELLKDYKKMANGKYISCYMEMSNLQNKRKSILLIDNFQSGSTATEAYFSPAMLEK